MTDNHSMTPRELFRRIMRFEAPDRTPLWHVEGIADRAQTARTEVENTVTLKPAGACISRPINAGKES